MVEFKYRPLSITVKLIKFSPFYNFFFEAKSVWNLNQICRNGETSFFAFCVFFFEFSVWGVGEGGWGRRDCGSYGHKAACYLQFSFWLSFHWKQVLCGPLSYTTRNDKLKEVVWKISLGSFCPQSRRMSCPVSSCLSGDLIKMDCAWYSLNCSSVS